MKTLVKILIWIGAFIISLVAEIIADAIFQNLFPGYRMGDVLRVGFIAIMVIIGIKLSRRWEFYCRSKQVSSVGKTRRECLIEQTPGFIIDICKSNQSVENLEKTLQQFVAGGVISAKNAKELVEEFGKQKT